MVAWAKCASSCKWIINTYVYKYKHAMLKGRNMNIVPPKQFFFWCVPCVFVQFEPGCISTLTFILKRRQRWQQRRRRHHFPLLNVACVVVVVAVVFDLVSLAFLDFVLSKKTENKTTAATTYNEDLYASHLCEQFKMKCSANEHVIRSFMSLMCEACVCVCMCFYLRFGKVSVPSHFALFIRLLQL